MANQGKDLFITLRTLCQVHIRGLGSFRWQWLHLRKPHWNTWLSDPKLFWSLCRTGELLSWSHSFWTINWEDIVLGPEYLKANRRASDLYKNALEIVMSCSWYHNVLHKQLAIEYYSCFLLFGLFLLTIQWIQYILTAQVGYYFFYAMKCKLI